MDDPGRNGIDHVVQTGGRILGVPAPSPVPGVVGIEVPDRPVCQDLADDQFVLSQGGREFGVIGVDILKQVIIRIGQIRAVNNHDVLVAILLGILGEVVRAGDDPGIGAPAVDDDQFVVEKTGKSIEFDRHLVLEEIIQLAIGRQPLLMIHNPSHRHRRGTGGLVYHRLGDTAGTAIGEREHQEKDIGFGGFDLLDNPGLDAVSRGKIVFDRGPLDGKIMRRVIGLVDSIFPVPHLLELGAVSGGEIPGIDQDGVVGVR